MLYIFIFSVHLFSPFGNVTVIWISDISAFVALRDRTAASSVLGNGWSHEFQISKKIVFKH
jgi:hypothetical protein